MTSLPSVKGKDVSKALEKAGFKLARSKKELIYKKEGYPFFVRIPNHPSKNVAPGTLRAIIKAAGLTIEEFIEFL